MAHMTRHELKHNEMEDIGEKISAWYDANSKLISALLIIVLAGILGYKGYTIWEYNKTAKASAEIGIALQNYNNAQNQTDAAKRKELLNTAIMDSQRITRDYAGTPAAHTAQMLLGNAYYYLAVANVGNADESNAAMKNARDAFEKFNQMAVTAQEKAVGQLALGQTLENLLFVSKDLNLAKQATDAFDQVVKLVPGSYLAADAQLSKARVLQAESGRQSEAANLYKQISENRKPEPITSEKNDKESKTHEIYQNGLTQEDVNEIQNFEKLSYSQLAVEALDELKGLPTEPQNTPDILESNAAAGNKATSSTQTTAAVTSGTENKQTAATSSPANAGTSSSAAAEGK
jgi:hypothetical protein